MSDDNLHQDMTTALQSGLTLITVFGLTEEPKAIFSPSVPRIGEFVALNYNELFEVTQVRYSLSNISTMHHQIASIVVFVKPQATSQ